MYEFITIQFKTRIVPFFFLSVQLLTFAHLMARYFVKLLGVME